MTAYAFTILPAIDPPIENPASSYLSIAEGNSALLDYGSISTSVEPPVNPLGSNFRLAFSTTAGTPRPTIGQLWPRGSGEA